MAAEAKQTTYRDTYCKSVGDLNLVLNSIIFVQDMNETTLTQNTFSSVMDYIVKPSFGKPYFTGSGSDGTCIYKSNPGEEANHLADNCHYDIDIMYEVDNFKAYEELFYHSFRTKIDNKSYINLLIYLGEGKYSQYLEVGNPMQNRYVSSVRFMWKLMEIYSNAMVDDDCYCHGIYSKNKYGNICSPCIERNEKYLNHSMGKAKIWAEQIQVVGPSMTETMYIENKISTDRESIAFDDRLEYEGGDCIPRSKSVPRKSKTAKLFRKAKENQDIVIISESDVLSSEIKIHLGIDHVPAIHCPCWPVMAYEFLVRKRSYDWPPRALIIEMYKSGVHIVAKSYNKPHTLFKQSFYAHFGCLDMMLWRYSFSVAETQLIETFTRCQIRCLLLAKSLVKDILVHFHTYHYKTVMFWLCEQYPVQDWKEDKFAELFLLYLKLLGKFIKVRNIPHFFLMDYNICEDISEEKFLEVLSAFHTFYSNITEAIIVKLQEEPFDDLWHKFPIIWFSTYKCLSKLKSTEEKSKKIAFARHFLLLSNFLKTTGNVYGNGINHHNSTLYSEMAINVLKEYPELASMDHDSLVKELDIDGIFIQYEGEKLQNVKAKPTLTETEEIIKLMGGNFEYIGTLTDKVD